ncbi:unnamed protein product [Spirodela intermedia]|uniref:Uncharacterized protein n=1 Tax=Spirodela intermedia TaxID=51605 RepID=A0A7I8KR01_SPIIN|nr:unnamed protein product [Spirodela intermedia]
MAGAGVEVTSSTIHRPYTLRSRRRRTTVSLITMFPSISSTGPPLTSTCPSCTRCLLPHLAGRLSCDERGWPSVHLNDAGVRVVETRLPRRAPPGNGGVEELLQIQLNRFACGGARSCPTTTGRPSPSPGTLPVRVQPPGRRFRADAGELAVEAPAETAAAAEAVETPNVVVHYSVNFLSKLKARLPSDNPDRRYSTFQVAVNGRARMKPKVPMEYFGNLVLWAYPRMTVADVIHAAVSAVDGYFKSFVDFRALAVEDEAEAGDGAVGGNSLSPNMEVDSWLSFQYHELDFGGGAPFRSSLSWAVDVQVALHPDKVSIFKEIAHALD